MKGVNVFPQEFFLLQLLSLELAVVAVDLVQRLEGLPVGGAEQGALRAVRSHPARLLETGLLPATGNCRGNTHFEILFLNFHSLEPVHESYFTLWEFSSN